jgi:hypothetical protein
MRPFFPLTFSVSVFEVEQALAPRSIALTCGQAAGVHVATLVEASADLMDGAAAIAAR